MRGGLELDFEGKGLTVILLTVVPQLFEALTVAAFTKAFFDMPFPLCIANGFCIGAVSPAVLVPSVMTLIELKRGTKKGIPQVMLAASSFDDILAITLYSVFSSISIDSVLAEYKDLDPKVVAAAAAAKKAAAAKNKTTTNSTLRLLEGADDGTSVKTMIGMNIFYVTVGFLCAIAVGNAVGCFNSCTRQTSEEEIQEEKLEGE